MASIKRPDGSGTTEAKMLAVLPGSAAELPAKRPTEPKIGGADDPKFVTRNSHVSPDSNISSGGKTDSVMRLSFNPVVTVPSILKASVRSGGVNALSATVPSALPTERGSSTTKKRFQ